MKDQKQIQAIIDGYDGSKTEDDVDSSEIESDHVVVYHEPERYKHRYKKVVQEYTCDECGRKKTVRFTTVPTPASYGRCPRCKTGNLYAQLITRMLDKKKEKENEIK